jgi:hypothetical protein
MSIKLAAFGFAMLLVGTGAASAQTSLTASLPDMLGGTGTSRNGTGFNGSLGDPDYWVAGTDLPASEGHYPGPYGTMGPPGLLPSASRYAPPPAMQYSPAMQYNWTSPPPR